MIIRIKQFIPPTDFGRRSFTHQLHIPMWTIRTRIFLIMLVQQEYSRIYILQSKFIIFIHISKIGGIRIIRRCIQQILIGRIRNHHYRIALLQHGRNRIMQTRTHPKRKQQAKQQDSHRFTHSRRQTEIETTPFPQFTLYIKDTSPEQFIRFLIFLNDSLTIHQSETTALILLQNLRISYILHSNDTGVIYFLTDNTSYIFFGNPPPVVFYGNLDIRIRSTGIHFDCSSFRSIFSGVFRQRVNHKQSQCPVSFHHNRSRFYFQLLIFHFKSTSPFA